MGLRRRLARVERALLRLESEGRVLFAYHRPVSTRIVLEELPVKMRMRKAGGAISFPQLASAGGTLEALDAGGNVVAGGIDPAKTTVAWSTSDTSVLTVSVPDPADTTKALVKSTGKVGSGITITAALTNNDGSPPLPPAVSSPIDVPAGPPTQAEIVIGTPA